MSKTTKTKIQRATDTQRSALQASHRQAVRDLLAAAERGLSDRSLGERAERLRRATEALKSFEA